VSTSRAALEKAILHKALQDPEFRARLLEDPLGLLKGLANESAHATLSLRGRWILGSGQLRTRRSRQETLLLHEALWRR
jgi:hypothetical protein